jgi:hypothetical protein
MSKCEEPDLGYMQWHADAERRHRAGERQLWCGMCGKWIWEAHISEEHRPRCMTKQEFDQFVKKSQRMADAMDRAYRPKGAPDGK